MNFSMREFKRHSPLEPFVPPGKSHGKSKLRYATCANTTQEPRVDEPMLRGIHYGEACKMETSALN